jgi:hypothetical protein
MILIQNVKSISFKQFYIASPPHCFFRIQKKYVYLQCSFRKGNALEDKQYNVKLSDYIVFTYTYRSAVNHKKYRITPGDFVSKEEFYEKLLRFSD